MVFFVLVVLFFCCLGGFVCFVGCGVFLVVRFAF